MTEHSIEELARQWVAARSRVQQADADLSAAKQRLDIARLNATGLAGHVVEGPKWGPGGKPVRIVARRIAGWNNDKVGGLILKKDGNEGERHGEVIISLAKDLGLYEP